MDVEYKPGKKNQNADAPHGWLPWNGKVAEMNKDLAYSLIKELSGDNDDKIKS